MSRPITVTSALLSSIRAGADAFLLLQRMRIAAHETPILHFSRRAASEQSLSRLDAPLGDERDVDTEILWDLANRVIGILEAGVDTSDAACAYATWYRTYFTTAEELHRIRDQIAANLPTLAEDAFEGTWNDVIMAILRSFLAGHLDLAAGLLAASMSGVRHRAPSAFSPEDEVCFGDIIRLMTIEARSPSQFLQWQAEASRLIADARYIFSPERGNGDPQSAPNQLRAMALDILVMMSGDIPLVLDTCNSTGVDALGFACALCSIIHPFTPLEEVHRMFKTACAQADNEGHWMNPAVEAILSVRSTTDLIGAMEVVQETVAVEFPEGGSDQDDESDVDRQEVEMKRFCISFMAAHVADICLPSVLPMPPHTELLFIRNNLVRLYVAQFMHHAALWSTGLTYLAFSPLVNPEALQQCITDCMVPLCSNDTTIRKQYNQFYRNHLDAGGPLQHHLRQTLRANCDGSTKVLESWFRSFDEAVQYANFHVQESVINAAWDRGQHAVALWEAIATHQTGLVQRHIGACLAREDALVAMEAQEVISHVGEAVQSGLIPLDSCPNGNLSTMLRLASALVDVLEQPSASSSTPSAEGTASNLGLSSSAGPAPGYATAVSPQQRLASTEYLLHHGFGVLHTATLIRLIRGSMRILETEYVGAASPSTLNHLTLVNTVINKLCCRAKSTSARTSREGHHWDTQLNTLRVQIAMRVAMGR